MKIYLLSYELRTPDNDYSKFYEFIEHIGDDRVHVLRDSWWIASKETLQIEQLCSEIRDHLTVNDVFYVEEMTESNSNINGWMASSSWNWLRDKMNKG